MNPGAHVTEPRHPIRDDLKAYCDGELSRLRRAVVRRHLEACVACREEVHAMHRLHQKFQRDDTPAAPLAPALRERIMAQVADVPPLPAPRRAPRLLQYGLAASFAVNCLFLVLLNRVGTVPPPEPLSVVRPLERPTHAPSSMRVSPLPQRKPDGGGLPMHRDGKAAVPNSATPPVAVAPHGGAARHVRPETIPDLERPPARRQGAAASSQTAPAEPSAVPIHPRAADDTARPTPVQDALTLRRVAKRLGDAADTGPDKAADVPAPVPPPPSVTPPPLAPMAPMAAQPPGADVERFGRTGFAGDTPVVGADRETPTATQPWPAIPQPSATAPATPVARTVVADWQVDERGRVSDIHLRGAESAAVEAAIQDAVRHNHYLPALKNGRPIAARMSLTFVVNS